MCGHIYPWKRIHTNNTQEVRVLQVIVIYSVLLWLHPNVNLSQVFFPLLGNDSEIGVILYQTGMWT